MTGGENVFKTPQDVTDALLRHYVRTESVETTLTLEPVFELNRQSVGYRRRRIGRYAAELSENRTCDLSLNRVEEVASEDADLEIIAYYETALTYAAVLVDVTYKYEAIERRSVTRKINEALERGATEDATYEVLLEAGVAVYNLASLVVDGDLFQQWLDRVGETDDVIFAHPDDSTDALKSEVRCYVNERDHDALQNLRQKVRDGLNHEWTRSDLLQFDPIAFEQLLAQLWATNHNSSRVTPARKDRGVDVVVQLPSGKRVLIQAKRYSPGNPVGISEVQRTAGLLHEFTASMAVVATSGSFTESAKQSARVMDDVSLLNGKELCAQLSDSPLCPPIRW